MCTALKITFQSPDMAKSLNGSHEIDTETVKIIRGILSLYTLLVIFITLGKFEDFNTIWPLIRTFLDGIYCNFAILRL